MQLHISFDMTDLDKALIIAKQVEPFADIIEVGTLTLLAHGVSAISAFKKAVPEATILADAKIIDRGAQIVNLCAQAGADWVTVMAGTSPDAIHLACKTAREQSINIMLDLIDAGSLGQSALEAATLGADALLLHQPYDEEASLDFLDKWDMVRGNTTLPVYISAKITNETIHTIAALNPHGIIIGETITNGQNPAEQASFFKHIITNR